MNHVCTYLIHLFKLGISSGSLNSIRSALSFFTQNSSLDLGNHPMVARCFKSFYKMRPNFPRYVVTWDVGIVLRFLASWHPPEELSLKQLTLKTVTLIALTASDRAQTIHCIDIDHMHFGSKGLECHIPALLKHSRRGRPARTVLCVEWDAPELDVCNYVQIYLRKTFKFRLKAVRLGKKKPTQLFLSHRTGKPVERASISRWIREVLGLSGIDITTFSAHSTRSASASAAARCGASPQQIMKQGDWSNLGTYQRFYDRVPDDTPVGRLILSSQCKFCLVPLIYYLLLSLLNFLTLIYLSLP